MAETALTETTDTQTPEHEVILTETAAAKVASLLAQEGRDDLRLRVAVQPGPELHAAVSSLRPPLLPIDLGGWLRPRSAA